MDRFRQFSGWRGILFTAGVVGLLVGALILHWCGRMRQVHAIHAITELHGEYDYDWVADPDGFVSFSGTRMGDVELQQISRDLAVLPNLVYLDLSDTQVSDRALMYLKNLRHLSGLDLAGTNVTDTGILQLRHLPNLRWLSLARTRITDSGLRNLAPLTQLESVDIQNTSVTETGIHQLKLSLKRLRVAGHEQQR